MKLSIVVSIVILCVLVDVQAGARAGRVNSETLLRRVLTSSLVPDHLKAPMREYIDDVAAGLEPERVIIDPHYERPGFGRHEACIDALRYFRGPNRRELAMLAKAAYVLEHASSPSYRNAADQLLSHFWAELEAYQGIHSRVNGLIGDGTSDARWNRAKKLALGLLMRFEHEEYREAASYLLPFFTRLREKHESPYPLIKPIAPLEQDILDLNTHVANAIYMLRQRGIDYFVVRRESDSN